MRLFWTLLPKALEGPLRACRWHFFIAACFSALINILYLAPTIYMMQVYDRVVPTSGIMTLVWITAVVGVAMATLAALDSIRGRLMMRASLRLNRLLSGEILDRLMARSKVKAGEPSTAQAMREFDVLRQALGGPAATALFDAPWTPLYLIVAFMIHPALGAMIIAGGVILIILALTNERQTKIKSKQAHVANAAAYASQQAAIGKAEVVRALGMRRALISRQIIERRAGLEANTEVQFSSNRYNSIVKFVRMFMQSLALGVGAWLAVEGMISVGSIIAASVLLSRALQPIEQVVGIWPQIVQARLAIQTLGTLFESTQSSDVVRTALPDPKGYLELDRIHVRSPQGQALLLKNVSLKMSPGEILGVIGPSGAGKTTLARIAAGALSPDAGEVRVDNANVNDWDADRLALHIGYLPQNSSLLPGTVSENISRFSVNRGMPQAMIDEEVVKAAQAAGAHEMILRFANGYDTRLEEDGHQVSAGQAQRIALARALFGEPKILVLDEPNSALDADGEEALNKAVAHAKANGASIMIVAHRTNVLANADRLLVLQDGEVSQIGPRQEVIEELRKRAATRPNVVPMVQRV